jgi:EpsI family protein
MGNIMVRMAIVIGVMLSVKLGLSYVGLMSHPAVVEPQIPLEQFPMTVTLPDKGTWQGKETKLDEQTFNQSEVSVAVSRIYTKDNQVLKFLLAEYKESSKGLYHNPMNCYRSQGFALLSTANQPLKTNNRADSTVNVSVWKRENEKVIVAYWYEIGDHTLYERQDLLSTQWAMRGKTQWPVMFKVLLEMPAGEDDQSKTAILEMAQYVRAWLGDEKVRPQVD